MRRMPSAKAPAQKALPDTRPLCEQNLSTATNIHNDLIKEGSLRHNNFFVLTDGYHKLYETNTPGYLVAKVIILLGLYANNSDHVLASEINSLLNRIEKAATPKNYTVNLMGLLEMIQESLNKIMDNSPALITPNGTLAHLIASIFIIYKGHAPLTHLEPSGIDPRVKEKIAACFNELAERRLPLLPNFTPIPLKALTTRGIIQLPDTRYRKYIVAASSAKLSTDCAIRVLECYTARSRLARFWNMEFTVPTRRTHRELVEIWIEALKNGRRSLESILTEFCKLPTTPDSDTEHAKTALYALLRIKEEEAALEIKGIFDRLIDKLPIPEKGTFSKESVKNDLNDFKGYGEKIGILKVIIQDAKSNCYKVAQAEQAEYLRRIQETEADRKQAELYIPFLLQNNPLGLAKHLETATVRLGFSTAYQRLDSFYADHIASTLSSGLRTDCLLYDEQVPEPAEIHTFTGVEEKTSGLSAKGSSSRYLVEKPRNESASTLSATAVEEEGTHRSSFLSTTLGRFFSRRKSNSSNPDLSITTKLTKT